MRVPVYATPTQQANGLNPAQARPDNTNAQTLGLVGQAAQVYLHEKSKADTYRAEDGFNKLQESKIQLWGEAQERQGTNAFDVHNEYTKRYDEETAKIAEGMGDSAAEKFRQAAARGRLAFSAQLEGHQIQQIEAYKQKTALAGINLSLDETEKNAGTPIADQSVNRAIALGRMEADRQGLQGDAAADFMMGVSTKAHLSNVIGMFNSNRPAEALAYLEANKDSILKSAADKIRGPLGKAMAESEAVTLADQIEAKFPVRDEKAMDKMARDMVGKDADKLTSLRQELDYRSQKQRRATNEVQGSLMASYIGLDGRPRMSRRQIEKSPSYLEMTDADRLELKGKLDTWEERMQGKESRESILNRWAKFGEIKGNLPLLMTMTKPQLIAMGFDVDQTKELMTAKDGAEGKLSEIQNVTVKAEDFNRVLEENGLPSKRKDGEYYKIKTELEQEMRELQIEKKRKLNDAERDEILNRKLAKVRKVGSWGGSEVRMRDIKDSSEIEATSDERKAVLIRLAAKGLDLNDPYNFKAMLDVIRAKKGDK